MSTVCVNFSLYQATDNLLPVTIFDQDCVTPLNIAGMAFSFVLFRPGQPNILTKSTASGGIALTTPASGLLTVTLTASDLTLPANNYNFRVERTDSGADTACTEGLLVLLAK